MLSLLHFWHVTYKLVAKHCPDFFMLFFHRFTEITFATKKENKTLTPCLLLNPTRGNKSQSFLILS